MFVYGTLRPETSPGIHGMTHNVKIVNPNFKLEGFCLYMSHDYPTISEHKGSSVIGALCLVDINDEIALDRYEGYPNFYEKRDIKTDDKEIAIYFQPKPKITTIIESGDFIKWVNKQRLLMK